MRSGGPLRTRAIATLAAAGTLVGLAIAPAGATSIDRCKQFGCVRGDITVSRDEARWNFRVTDTRADGLCVYAKVEIDVGSGIDPDFRSDNACPKDKTVSFSDSDAYAGTQGAKVSLCRDDGVCEEVHYESEG